MTVPRHFSTFEEYFEQCTAFFEEYQNLYNFANTDVLVKGILETIPVDDLIGVDIFNDEFDIRQVAGKNDYLKAFFNKLGRLRANYEFNDEGNDDFTIDVPLSVKKKHEIIRLAKEIEKLCDGIGCDTVVDFGSGLGYLDQVIFKTTKYNVMGLECNESHYAGAKKRQNKYHTDSTDRVKYIKHTITDESHIHIDEFLKDKFPNSGDFCITGLHACADLTVDGMNIFLNMPNAKAMILMPCCYHKMRSDSLLDERFINFPLSNCLKEVYMKNRGFEYMRIPFLRLAAQPYVSPQNAIRNLVFNLLARGVLQLYAHKHNYKLRRRKCKPVRVRTIHNDFDSYAQDACAEGFSFIKNYCWDHDEMKSVCQKTMVEDMKSIWRELPPLTFKKAAIFILLQNVLQPVIENIILLDRIVYLKEKGLVNTTCKKIVNNTISPRCLAIFAHK